MLRFAHGLVMGTMFIWNPRAARRSRRIAVQRKRKQGQTLERSGPIERVPDYHGLRASVRPGQLSVRNGTAGNPIPLKSVAAGLACHA